MTTGGLASILFTDLVGSTELLEWLGDDAAEEVRREHFALLREAVESHGGEEVKGTGDGLMVAFRSCAGALACATAMQEATERQNEALADDVSLGLRIGVNAGDVIGAEGDYFGAAVVVAKRLCDRADGGQVLCSELVRRLIATRGGHSFRELGSLSLKGLADPIQAYELAWKRKTQLTSPADLAGPADAEEDSGPAGAWSPPLPVPLATDDAFVGRQAELDRLLQALERARAGARELVLLAGEPGMGKTRLAAELAQRAQGEGALCLYGHAYEENLLSFQPFVEAMTPYIAQIPAATLRAHVEDDLAPDLGKLLPELRRRLPSLPQPPKTDHETARYRMFEAADLLCSRIATEAPILLVLDDLHWADRPTLLLLRHLLGSHREAPVLIVGAYRESELSREQPFSKALAEFRRERPAERISLGGFAEEEVHSLIFEWAGAEPPDDFARTLHRETDGNPLFCREALRHLLARGAIGEGVGFPAKLSLERMDVPERVQDVIDGRVTRLSEPANLALSIASVCGREFGLRVLERVSGLQVEELLDALGDATAAQLIVEVPGTARYRFAHALVREVLHTGLSPARRRELHRRVGKALEELHHHDLEPHLTKLAHHFLEAAPLGEAERAIDYAQRAGERAIELLAYEEATSHYERALEALELAEHPDGGRRCELYLGLGDARTRAGDGPGARRAFEQAAEVARRLGAAEQFARAAIGVGEAELGAAWFAVAGIIDQPLIRLLEEARTALGDVASALRARVCAHLARQLYWSDDHERREQLAEEGVEVARRLEDPGELAAALAAKAFATFGPESVAADERLLSEALPLAEEADDRELVLQLQIPRLRLLRERGDRKSLDQVIDTYTALAEELRHAYGLWFARVLRATQAIFDGRFAEAERLAGEALGPELRLRDRNALQMFGGQIISIRFAQGRLPELEAAINEFAAKFPRLASWRITLAGIYAEAGREAEARRELERLAADEFAAVRQDAFWIYSMGQLSWVCASLDDRKWAGKLYELLLPYQDRYIVIPPLLGSLGPVSLHLGLLALVLRRFEEVARHIEDALLASGRMRDRPFIVVSQAIRAFLPLLAEGFDAEEQGVEAYRRAVEACRELGVKPLHERPLFRRTFLTAGEDLGMKPPVEAAFS